MNAWLKCLCLLNFHSWQFCGQTATGKKKTTSCSINNATFCYQVRGENRKNITDRRIQRINKKRMSSRGLEYLLAVQLRGQFTARSVENAKLKQCVDRTPPRKQTWRTLHALSALHWSSRNKLFWCSSHLFTITENVPESKSRFVDALWGGLNTLIGEGWNFLSVFPALEYLWVFKSSQLIISMIRVKGVLIGPVCEGQRSE